MNWGLLPWQMAGQMPLQVQQAVRQQAVGSLPLRLLL